MAVVAGLCLKWTTNVKKGRLGWEVRKMSKDYPPTPTQGGTTFDCLDL